MWEITWRTIKDRKFSLLIFSLIGLFFVVLYVGMYPSIARQADALKDVMKAYPPELMKAFGMEEGFSFSTLEKFLATEQYSMTWPIMAVALLVAWGGAAIAGEIEKGTIEILLAQPISRIGIFFSKYFSGIIAIFVFIILTILPAIPAAAIYNIKYQTSHYFIVGILGVLFCWAVFSLAMLFSVIFSDKGKVYFLSSGILLLMYVINLVANLKENVQDIKFISIFHYFNTNNALIKGEVDTISVAVLGGAAIILTVTAIIIFNKRDIAT